MKLRMLASGAAAAAGVLMATALIAGCSSTSGAAAPAATTAPKAGSTAGTGTPQRRMPGVSGLIADVEGRTLQVQSSSEQTAVSYTSKTAIEEITAGTADDLATGWCATVISTDTTSMSPGTVPTKITARSVSLSKASGGRCGRGFGDGGPGGSPSDGASGAPGGARGRTGGGPGGWPSGRPTGRPSGFPSGRPGGMIGTVANGKITRVTGSGFVMTATDRGSPVTHAVSVSTVKDTTITRQQVASPSAIKQGKCVVATGKADDTGAVAATRLIVSAAKNGSCDDGFARRQGGGRNG